MNLNKVENFNSIEELKSNLHNKFKKIFDRPDETNPVVQASKTWMILSEQLGDILGPEIHGQWFSPVQPIVELNDILVLQTESKFAAYWISTHYQKLIEALLQTQNKKLNCFIIPPK
jgi:hypothetical protein